jgi:hypothetical protein
MSAQVQILSLLLMVYASTLRIVGGVVKPNRLKFYRFGFVGANPAQSILIYVDVVATY